MPAAQLQSPEQVSTFTQRPKTESRDTSDTAPPPIPPKSYALPVALGVLSAILFITTFVFWSRVGDRDDSIMQLKNRSDQVQADAVQLRTQLAQDKITLSNLQDKTDEA